MMILRYFSIGFYVTLFVVTQVSGIVANYTTTTTATTTTDTTDEYESFPFKKTERNNKILDIYLHSETCNDPSVIEQAEEYTCCCNTTDISKIDRYCGTSNIVVNGREYSLKKRGYNVAVFYVDDGKWTQFEESKSFDTFKLETFRSFSEFYKLWEQIPEGSVLLAVVQDSAGGHNLDELKSIGAQHTVGFRESYIFVGKKLGLLGDRLVEIKRPTGKGPITYNMQIKLDDYPKDTPPPPPPTRQAPKETSAPPPQKSKAVPRTTVEAILGTLLGLSVIAFIILLVLYFRLQTELIKVNVVNPPLYEDLNYSRANSYAYLNEKNLQLPPHLTPRPVKNQQKEVDNQPYYKQNTNHKDVLHKQLSGKESNPPYYNISEKQDERYVQNTNQKTKNHHQNVNHKDVLHKQLSGKESNPSYYNVPDKNEKVERYVQNPHSRLDDSVKLKPEGNDKTPGQTSEDAKNSKVNTEIRSSDSISQRIDNENTLTNSNNGYVIPPDETE